MADLKPIEFPSHLTVHNLSEQELGIMTPQQQALAKDWNIIKRQNEWMMARLVAIHNVMVEHDALLDIFKKVLWLVGLLGASGGGIFMIFK